MSAPAVRPPWLDRSLPAERTNLSVRTVLQNFSQRDAPAAPNLSRARGAPGESQRREEGREGGRIKIHVLSFSGLYHLKADTGTPPVSSVRCVNSPWQGRDLLRTVRTSSVQSALRTNSWGPPSQH